MKIYSMTATFGKLEHRQLTLQPGLNVLCQPNEWGKSTWCAFLIAMFYGLDTRAKSTRGSLADKERFAPWSGSPMAGRIDLNWNGRDITLERSTKGRIPLGQFRAYETASGLDVPEITAANCGQLLLGVERSVYARAGFIRFSDLPVTQDEALRRRLNNLVTTADESGDGDRLGAALKAYRNRIRYNRTGLLPEAEARQDMLEGQLSELRACREQLQKLRLRQGELDSRCDALRNHRQALRYAGAEADAHRVAQAREAYEESIRAVEAQERACARLPSREQTREMIRKTRQFSGLWNAARMEEGMLPAPPVPPEPPAPFAGCTGQQAMEKAQTAQRTYASLSGKGWLWLLAAGAAGVIGGIVLLLLSGWLPGACCGALGLGLLTGGLVLRKRHSDARAAVCGAYPDPNPDSWTALAEDYARTEQTYREALAACRANRAELDLRLEELDRQRKALCGQQDPQSALDGWLEAERQWDAFDSARRDSRKLEAHWNDLKAMAGHAEKPAAPDALAYSPEETETLLLDAQAEQRRLQTRQGQLEGRMEALGEEAALTRELGDLQERIRKLEAFYAALTLAQETLAESAAELQRRFAPEITRRAQAHLSVLTGGRYRRLTLGDDFSLGAEAEQEDVVRPVLWRSDGTMDQLYLSLRLAVAEALTPEAPIVLDDALIRFDDERLRAAFTLLRELAKDRQILVFTCREQEKRAAEA